MSSGGVFDASPSKLDLLVVLLVIFFILVLLNVASFILGQHAARVLKGKAYLHLRVLGINLLAVDFTGPRISGQPLPVVKSKETQSHEVSSEFEDVASDT